MADTSNKLELTAEIVSSFVERNKIAATELGDLIRSVHQTLSTVGTVQPEASEPANRPTAAQIKRSVQGEYLISFEDGRKYKSLKRHLRTKYDMSPEDYRAKWGLPKDYPMVAPAYSARRSELARASGLGSGGRRAAAKGKRKA